MAAVPPKEPPNQLFITYLERLRAKCLLRRDGRSVALYDKALASLRLYPVPLRSAAEAQSLRNIGPRVVADLECCFARYASRRVSPTRLSRITERPTKKPKRVRQPETSLLPVPAGRREDDGEEEEDPHTVSEPKRHKAVPRADAATVVLGSVALRAPVVPARDSLRPLGTVRLLVDFRELKRKRGRQLKQALEELHVPVEERVLALSDMLWVVQTASGAECVMRHGVERKTVSDLSESIKDGRYYEQKERLKHAQLRTVVYLIEGPLTLKLPSYSYHQAGGGGGGAAQYRQQQAWAILPPETLEAAIASTSYGSSDFLTQRCKDVHATALFLARYTMRLQALVDAQLADEHVFAYGVDTFNAQNKKDLNPTVTDIFARQLMRVSGVSATKVAGIVQVYPTMAMLADAYHDVRDDRAATKALLAKIPLPGGTRTLGPKASEAIAKAVTRGARAQ